LLFIILVAAWPAVNTVPTTNRGSVNSSAMTRPNPMRVAIEGTAMRHTRLDILLSESVRVVFNTKNKNNNKSQFSAGI